MVVSIGERCLGKLSVWLTLTIYRHVAVCCIHVAVCISTLTVLLAIYNAAKV